MNHKAGARVGSHVFVPDLNDTQVNFSDMNHFHQDLTPNSVIQVMILLLTHR